MAKKKIGVTLEKALHQEVKSVAAKKGITIEEAYQQALETWLAGADGIRTGQKQSDEILAFVADYLKQNGPGSLPRNVLLAEIGYPEKTSKVNPARSAGKKMG
jgi:hypothetical protein